MPDIDPISKLLGELHYMASKTVETCDIIRSDQINQRREIDFLKTMAKESKEMVDAMAPTVKEHHIFIKKYEPLMDTLENIETGKRVGKWGLAAVIALGSANLLVPAWAWIKSLLVITPTIGPGP